MNESEGSTESTDKSKVDEVLAKANFFFNQFKTRLNSFQKATLVKEKSDSHLTMAVTFPFLIPFQTI